MTRTKQVDLSVPNGIELVAIDGGKRRARFRVEDPLSPGEFILIEALPDKTKRSGDDPYDVKIPAEGDA